MRDFSVSMDSTGSPSEKFLTGCSVTTSSCFGVAYFTVSSPRKVHHSLCQSYLSQSLIFRLVMFLCVPLFRSPGAFSSDIDASFVCRARMVEHELVGECVVGWAKCWVVECKKL